MSDLVFKFFHQKNEKGEKTNIINCNKDENISEPFIKFSKQINQSIKDFIFYFNGSILNYENGKHITDVFFQSNPNTPINVFAFPLKKPKEVAKTEDKPIGPFSQSKIPSEKKEKEKENSSTKDIVITEDNKVIEKVEKIKEEKGFYTDIICPKCKTSAIIDKDGIKLNIINCGNFHRVSDVKYDKYDEYEFDLDDNSEENKAFLKTIPEFKCKVCSAFCCENTPPDNKIFRCSCGINICQVCCENHKEKDHYKFEYEDRNYKCFIHGKNFNSYCLDCNENICELCEEKHPENEHEVIKYQHLRPKNDYIKSIKNEIEKQKETLSKFIEKSKKILKDILEETNNYISKYIRIENTFLNRYNNKDKAYNFQLLQNLRNRKIFFENILFQELEKFNNESENLEYLKRIFNLIRNAKREVKPKEDQPKDSKIKNILEIKYNIGQKKINRDVRIFDSIFVENNKDKCSLIIEYEGVNDEYKKVKKEIKKELSEYFRNNSDSTEIKVTLTEHKPMTNLSYMFNNCIYLQSIESKNWNTINVTNMESMFQLTRIKNLPDISKWNTSSLINMRGMFSKCTKLTEIPIDIQKLNTINVKDMSLLFNGCSSLISIPNLQKWDTRNVEDMSYMFSRCIKLKDLHGIGKWNTINVKNMCGIFNRCQELTKLPDISRWNTINVVDMSILFQFCSKIETIPDIYRWNISKVKDMSGIFSECSLLKNLSSIGRWTPNEVTSMCGLFNECNKLEVFPDMSKWNTSKVTDMSGLFCSCSSMAQLPNISSWNTNNVTDMSYMFDGCTKLKDISFIKNWNMSKVTDKTDALKGTGVNENDVNNWMNKK